MFNGIKNKIEERIKETLSPIYEQRKEMEVKLSSIKEGKNRMQTDMSQVADNTTDLTTYASHNIEEESALIHSMDDFSEQLKTAAKEYKEIAEGVNTYYETVTELVEENKHYTSPSKYLTEVPITMRQNCQMQETKIDEMAEYGRQMGMMALNAAIEAGRMGETGTQFVEVSEEIRQLSFKYEQTALSMKEELKETQQRISELEENALRLVALIKDGNISTARLMKKSAELNKMIETSSIRDFSEDVICMRDKVIAMRNLDEEMTKTGERNKMQLDDIQEEMQAQEGHIEELERQMADVFDKIKENLS